MSKITIDQAVVEQALDLIEENFLQLPKSSAWQSIQALRAVLDQPQSNPTAQDISDSALLGNIESPFNACMHQEHCKRWKAKTGADSSLRSAVQQACDWISGEPGRRPISAGRLLAILTNALAAAPQLPVVENMQPDPAPYLWYDPNNGDTWTREAINDGCCLPGGLIALYANQKQAPLTVEQIDGIVNDLDPILLDTPTGLEEEFCRAIERAHGIGGDL